MISMYDSIVI